MRGGAEPGSRPPMKHPMPEPPVSGLGCAEQKPLAALLYLCNAEQLFWEQTDLLPGTNSLPSPPAGTPDPPTRGASLPPAPQPEIFCKHKRINKLARAPMNISCLTCPRFLPFNGCSPLCLCLFEHDTFPVEHKSLSLARWRGNRSAPWFSRPRHRRVQPPAPAGSADWVSFNSSSFPLSAPPFFFPSR